MFTYKQMQQFFKTCQKYEISQAKGFSSTFGVSLEKLPAVPGVSGDYMVMKKLHRKMHTLQFPMGSVIEFKDDKASTKTGNLYIEFRQTSDNWFTSQKSGILLAIDHGHKVVIRSGTDNYIMKTLKEYETLVSHSHRTITTRQNANGNRRGCFTNGYLVKIKFAKEQLSCYTTPVDDFSSIIQNDDTPPVSP